MERRFGRAPFATDPAARRAGRLVRRGGGGDPSEGAEARVTPRSRRRAACCRSEPSPSLRSLRCHVERPSGGGEPACRCPTRTSSSVATAPIVKRRRGERAAMAHAGRRRSPVKRESDQRGDAPAPDPARRQAAPRSPHRAGAPPRDPAPSRPWRAGRARSALESGEPLRNRARRFRRSRRTASGSSEPVRPRAPRLGIHRARPAWGTALRKCPSPFGRRQRAPVAGESAGGRAKRSGSGRARSVADTALRKCPSPFGTGRASVANRTRRSGIEGARPEWPGAPRGRLSPSGMARSTSMAEEPVQGRPRRSKIGRARSELAALTAESSARRGRQSWPALEPPSTWRISPVTKVADSR